LEYAPKSVRMAALETARRDDRQESEPQPLDARPSERRAVPRRQRQLARPLELAKQVGGLEGDVAVEDLRERTALRLGLPLEPPMRDGAGLPFGMVGRLVGLVTLATITASGLVWTLTPQPGSSGSALAAYEGPAADKEPGLSNIDFNSFHPADFQPPLVQVAGLKAEIMRPRDDAPAADRPRVLAPVPWPVADGGRDLATMPRDTQTSERSDVTASVDTGSLHRSPAAESRTVPLPPTALRVNDGEVANLLASGRTFLIIGDVTGARLAFRRAAESGDAEAALALGGTFDPLVLRSLGAVGVAADPATARSWYQKAAALGSRDAPERLNQLARSAR
jgi:hypothetical protein